MPSLNKKSDSSNKAYWRSLSEFADEPEFQDFLAREFPSSDPSSPGTFDRRRFIQLMGASLALASGTACRWPEEKILPFARTPAGYVHGVPKRYATASHMGGVASSLVATVYEGRPVKIEGNPSDPLTGGGTDAYAQASILGMYDPDRSRTLHERRGNNVVAKTWQDFREALKLQMLTASADAGAGVRLLVEASSSPARADLLQRLKAKYAKLQVVEYESISWDNQRAGLKRLFGRSVQPIYALNKADTILCLDDDLLALHPGGVAHSVQFASRRKPESGGMVRLYAVESRVSQTGAAADHRLQLKSAKIQDFVLALRSELGKLGVAGLGTGSFSGTKFDAPTEKMIKVLAKELNVSKAKALITVGAGQPSYVHAVAHQINVALGARGNTVSYHAVDDGDRPSHREALIALAKDMDASLVKTLIIVGGNPVYDAPADLGLGNLIKSVPFAARLGIYEDETSALCGWHVPRSHELEAWGDGRGYDGSVLLAQPTINPLYDTKNDLEILQMMLGEAESSETAVRAAFKTPGDWRKSVHDGRVANSALAVFTGPVSELPAEQAVVADGMELALFPSSSVYDGRFANNGWLQELPDFATKMVWDNAALMAVATAAELHVKSGDMVRIKRGDRKIDMPVYVMPGQCPGSIAVARGYGRTHAGHIGGLKSADVASAGFDVGPMVVSAVEGNFFGGITIEKLGKTYPIATTQDQFAIDTVGQKGIAERVGELIRSATLDEYRKQPDFAQHKVHHPPLTSLWNEHKYDEGHRWGMAIDLNACTGCGTCVVACQAENNIPVVGKERVMQGRVMHWIRIDRYFAGDPTDPRIVHQPVTCMHCELAPCEQVCPVAATVHSAEGLSDMAYNRCIGTRYCANNCPYKVRRFNYFNYNKKIDNDPKHAVERLKFNPEVTVRHRGVMEKCSFCVQRIRNVSTVAKTERRALIDGDIKTACQQACPSGAISFGDLNDPKSVVRADHGNARAYAMLGELNIKPRTRFLAKITNPNPELNGDG